MNKIKFLITGLDHTREQIFLNDKKIADSKNLSTLKVLVALTENKVINSENFNIDVEYV